MFQLTETQHDMLLLAIESAENPGACSYKEGCVVGKLLQLYNLPLPENDGISVDVIKHGLNFPTQLLYEIQRIWDSYSSVDEAKSHVYTHIDESVILRPEPPLVLDDTRSRHRNYGN